jgi:uncharacterized protein (DUF362 family)
VLHNAISHAGSFSRRRLLQAFAANAALAGTATKYQVGVGRNNDPYAATKQAIAACGQWPAAAMAGKTVAIKPNLVIARPSNTGATVDPEVVRAVVDMALAAGAEQVLIVENGYGPPAPFKPCGYEPFRTYRDRVKLVDVSAHPIALTPVPNGLTYRSLYLPATMVQSDLFFISVGKLKTHVQTGATLSMKCLVGLASRAKYSVPKMLARQDLHFHGMDESVVDLNLARPVHFAVIDGIWGMEGQGPLTGPPVRMNHVLAGLNPVAVDRIGLELMRLPQNSVMHLNYAAAKGMGPVDASTIGVNGDMEPRRFAPGPVFPRVWRPVAEPASFSLKAGRECAISYKVSADCLVRAEIVQDSESEPGIKLVRTLRDWTARPAGPDSLTWNGKAEDGAPVAPGTYLARVQAKFPKSWNIFYATSWVRVEL